MAGDDKPVDGTQDRNVEQIRDILFGGQMRDYERRFQELDARIAAELSRLRDEHGLADASPFSYVSGVSPDLNLYCEPPQFLQPDERRPFEPLAFIGSLWPDGVAPFKAAILNLKIGDAACDGLCERLYAALGDGALYDDRADRAGAKFADADLMGHPWQIVVGPRGAAAGTVELKRRATGERVEVTPEEALSRIG